MIRGPAGLLWCKADETHCKKKIVPESGSGNGKQARVSKLGRKIDKYSYPVTRRPKSSMARNAAELHSLETKYCRYINFIVTQGILTTASGDISAEKIGIMAVSGFTENSIMEY